MVDDAVLIKNAFAIALQEIRDRMQALDVGKDAKSRRNVKGKRPSKVRPHHISSHVHYSYKNSVKR